MLPAVGPPRTSGSTAGLAIRQAPSANCKQLLAPGRRSSASHPSVEEDVTIHPFDATFRQVERLRDPVYPAAADGRLGLRAAGEAGGDEDVDFIDGRGVQETTEHRRAAL